MVGKRRLGILPIPTAGELTNFLGDKLAKYKLPRDVILVDALPRTAYDKVVKSELKESFERRTPLTN
jgi:acyl-coenzyme A synthetase/AMP-(fatty) acid ligase